MAHRVYSFRVHSFIGFMGFLGFERQTDKEKERNTHEGNPDPT